MKQIKTILTCGLVLATVGITSLVVADEAMHEGKAIVRSVHGNVVYQPDGTGEWKKLHVNAELSPKAVLKSDADPHSVAYLQVNGLTSTVKLMPDTTITLSKMEQMGGIFNGDSATSLKLDKGTVLGSVRKLAQNSTYEVAVPNGVAGIRGTDFSVTVTLNSDGSFTVDFRSVTGQLLCTVSTPPGAATPTRSENLQTGQTWTVTGTTSTGQTTTINNPTATPSDVQSAALFAISQVTQFILAQTAPQPAQTTQPTQPSETSSNTGGMSSGGSSDNSGDQ